MKLTNKNMKKIVNILTTSVVILCGLFINTSAAYADLVPFPYQTNEQRMFVTNISQIGILIGVVVLISWLIIRSIRRKNKRNVTNK